MNHRGDRMILKIGDSPQYGIRAITVASIPSRVIVCGNLRDTEFFTPQDPYIFPDYTITDKVAHDFKHDMIDDWNYTFTLGVHDMNNYLGSNNLRKGPFDTWTNKTTSGTIPATPRPGDKGFVLHSTGAEGNRVRKIISMLSRVPSGGSSSEGTGLNQVRETDGTSNDMPVVILDSQAHVNCTGNFSVLSNLKIDPQNVALVAANGEEMETFFSGSVLREGFELHDVHFCPTLSNKIIVSGSMLDLDNYQYECGRGKCSVRDLGTGRIVGEGRLVNRDYIMDYLKIPQDRAPVLDQPTLVSSGWNTLCSALLRRLGLNPRGH